MKKIDFYFKQISTNAITLSSFSCLNSKPLSTTCLNATLSATDSHTKLIIADNPVIRKRLNSDSIKSSSQQLINKKIKLDSAEKSIVTDCHIYRDYPKMAKSTLEMNPENSKNHSFLIDMQAFKMENKIMVQPEKFTTHDIVDDSFLIPYCFSSQSIKPFNLSDSSQDVTNHQSFKHKNKKAKNKIIYSDNNVGKEKEVKKNQKINTQSSDISEEGCKTSNKNTANNERKANLNQTTTRNEHTSPKHQNISEETVLFKDFVRSAIQSLLATNNITTSHLISTIQSYHNTRLNFDCLTQTLAVMPKDQSEGFFKVTLPCILSLVLDTPCIIAQPIPVLRRNMAACITMSQLQAACLLSNSFMATFHPHKPLFNSNSFTRLCGLTAGGRGRSQAGKLLCFFNYFRRVAMQRDSYGDRGLITIERKCLKEAPQRDWWAESKVVVGGVEVCHEGAIEDAQEHLQVDFANKFIGGGVLRTGAVQEEIRFSLCPEAVVSCLLVEKMSDNESVVLTGCEKFSRHIGYANTFSFHQDHHDVTNRDSWRRIACSIVAMDARSYKESSMQFRQECILRDLNKAYCGFSRCDFEGKFPLLPVATGNWGCGAFKGDLQLKSMIQLLAASMAGRRMRYYIFGETLFGRRLEEVAGILKEKQCSVGQLYRILECYDPHSASATIDLFTHISNNF